VAIVDEGEASRCDGQLKDPPYVVLRHVGCDTPTVRRRRYLAFFSSAFRHSVLDSPASGCFAAIVTIGQAEPRATRARSRPTIREVAIDAFALQRHRAIRERQTRSFIRKEALALELLCWQTRAARGDDGHRMPLLLLNGA